MYPIIVDNVTKCYKKYSHKHKFLTLKSAFVKRTLFSDLKTDQIFKAVNAVSFKVEDGKTLGIIGENGSGKSTILKLLAGISRPTSGEVITTGNISSLIELGAGFHPEISGRENIYINGIILGLTKKKIHQKFDEIVKFAELEDFIDNPVKTYSSGMHMRLGFSIAINVDPEILLIDEILSVGDASFMPKCLDKINEFKRNGKTIVYVSHDLATVERISDEVIWLKNGSIELNGYPKKVVDSYLEYIGKKDAEKAKIKHHQEELTEGKDKRWGSREIEISNVRIINGKGKETYILDSDEAFSINFDIKAAAEEKDFVFGLGIINYEGIMCYGSNTLMDDLKSDSFSGNGKVKINIPSLNLINGSYFLDLAVHKQDGYPFDYHHNRYTFKVVSQKHDVGITRIKHSWEFSKNIKISKI